MGELDVLDCVMSQGAFSFAYMYTSSYSTIHIYPYVHYFAMYYVPNELLWVNPQGSNPPAILKGPYSIVLSVHIHNTTLLPFISIFSLEFAISLHAQRWQRI